MRVLASDPFIAREHAESNGVELVPLETLLTESDVISLHAPLNPQSADLMGQRRVRAHEAGGGPGQLRPGGPAGRGALVSAPLDPGHAFEHHLNGMARDAEGEDALREPVVVGVGEGALTPGVEAEIDSRPSAVRTEDEDRLRVAQPGVVDRQLDDLHFGPHPLTGVVTNPGAATMRTGLEARDRLSHSRTPPSPPRIARATSRAGSATPSDTARVGSIQWAFGRHVWKLPRGLLRSR